MKRLHKIALGLFVLSAVAFFLTLLPPPVYQICSYNEHTHQEDCALYHLGPFALQMISEVLGRYSDLITALATVLLAIITWMLVSLGREQGETARRQLRAYVLNSGVFLIDGTTADPKPSIDRTDQPGIVLEIKNYGPTPATHVVHVAFIEVAQIALERTMSIDVATMPTSPSSVIGPAGLNTKSLWLDRSLSSQEKIGIQNGTYAIFVYGRIHYRDAFGENHWATYRLKYTNSVWPPYNKQPAVMNFCDGGNETD